MALFRPQETPCCRFAFGFLCLGALFSGLSVSPLRAQAPAASAGAPAALPAATPVPAGTLPSQLAATPTAQNAQTSPAANSSLPTQVDAQGKASSSAQAQDAPQNRSGQRPNEAPYQDPLEQPIRVPPASGTPAPTVVAMPPPATVASMPSMPSAFAPALVPDLPDFLGSTYIPVDSPIYAMALRLYSLGYLDSAFISMRPWTRRSLLHMLEKSSADIRADQRSEAVEILATLQAELREETPPSGERGAVYGIESVYSRLTGIAGQTLRDSFHIGQTLNNDYGRPYQPGFNNVTGFSSVNEWNRLSLYVRGEYQHSPSGTGYSDATAFAVSSTGDEIPFINGINLQPDTLPTGTLPAQNRFRLLEANLSFHLLGHEISGGKSDAWLGPGYGGAMAWSNNAENVYAFRINRVEPLEIPLLSRILGPVRYDFFVGALHGHTVPRDPWVHSEIFAFRPTSNFEFGFQRTVIWGGKGHVPITLHTFLRSFFDFNDTTEAEKLSRDDPGARYSDFNFSWRLPFVRRFATLYLDSIAHDDVTPVSAPRRAAYRTGLYLTQLPFMPKLDIRAEGVTTDPGVARSLGGQFNYFEIVQLQGYTNNGFIMGDWIGREAKGGQLWLTYHLSPNEWVQFKYLRKKNAKDFIPLGTTQNQYKIDVLKRLRPDLELNASVQFEHWKAPVYKPGANNDTTIAVQLRYFPKLHTSSAP